MAGLSVPPEVFFLDRKSASSLQAQIRGTVVAEILSHRAPPGARMPSTRRLASHLGVARMTVTLAYQELVAQGYLTAGRRSAYMVSDAAPAPRLAATPGGPRSDEAAPPGAEAGGVDWDGVLKSRLHLRRRTDKPVDWRAFRYPFIYGQMDEALFSHAAWRDCLRQATGRRDFGDLAGDALSADDPLLVNYIRARTLPRRGIAAGYDEILVTLGAQHALWLAIELLTRQPLKAVCENPGYPDTATALRWCGARVAYVDVDDDGLPPSLLPKDAKAVFVTPSHHAPTGATMTMDRRDELLAAARKRDFVVVEDDYDFQMSFLEPPSPALKSLDRDGRVIYVGSFSKSLFPGLRLGFLVGPARFIEEARHLRAIMLRHPPGHLQRTVAYFLAQGHYDRLVQGMRNAFAGRRAVMEGALSETQFRIAGAARFGGSSLWVRGPDGLDARRLAEVLRADSVLIEPGSPFFSGKAPPVEYFRLGYSSISAERIADGIGLIAARASDGGASVAE